MIIQNNRQFDKKFKKLNSKLKEKYFEKILIFRTNKFDSSLKIHKLNGFNPDRYSINITGDIRAQYQIIDKETFLFVDIGTHSELYS